MRLILSSSLFLALCLLTLLSASALGADPSISDPKPPIAIHGLMEEAKSLFELATKDDEACTNLYAQMKKGGPKADTVGKQSVHVKRLLRTAERLLDLGEPAGAELRMRYEFHELERIEAFNAFASMPQSQPFRGKAIAWLQKNLQKRLKKIEEVKSKAAQTPLEAQAALDVAYDEYEAVAGILNATERGPFSELIEASSKLAQVASAHRRQLVNQAVDKNASAVVVEVDRFLVDCSAAAGGGQAGQVKWSDKTLTSIDFVHEIMKQGFALQARLQRAITLHQLKRKDMLSGASFGSSSGESVANTSETTWSDSLSKLKSGLQDSIVKLIERDTQELAANDLSTRLAEYATALGRHAHRVAGDEWSNVFDDAISKAAKRVPEVEKSVRNYQIATKEVLRWKERFANKQASILAEKGKPLAGLLSAASNRTQSTPGYVASGQPIPFFYNTTFEALPALGKNLGKDSLAIVENVVRFDGDASVRLSKMDNFIYARLPNDFYNAGFATKLKTELMIEESKPPLSVRAASAIYTAERGENLTVGGIVTDVSAEGTVTRIALMKESAAPFTGLDTPVSLSEQPVRQASLRAALTPKWVRHRYALVSQSN